MGSEANARDSMHWCLVLLLFLLVYLPLDAFDADAFDTFEGSIVQVRVRANEDSGASALSLAVRLPEGAWAIVDVCAWAPPSAPTCPLPVTHKTVNLPRCDDPHVII